MPTTTIQPLPYPSGGDPASGPAQIKALAEAIETRVVMRFPSREARDTALPTGKRVAGMIAWVDADQAYYVWSTRGTTPSWRVLWQDTGWVDVPTRAGFAGQAGTLPQVRREGKAVHWRWGFASTGLTPSVASTVADVPEGYRPTQTVYVVPVVQRPDLPAARLLIDASGAVLLHPGPTLATYYIANFSWLLD